MKVVVIDNADAVQSVVIAVTLMCTLLSQRCYYHCCHNAVLVLAVTVLSTSVSNHCTVVRH